MEKQALLAILRRYAIQAGPAIAKANETLFLEIARG